jgi:hypothetical protein
MHNLYSTNCWLSLYIQKTYRKGIFYVWCSEYFNPALEDPHSPAALIPVSSSPAAIFRSLMKACHPFDAGDLKIINLKARFTSLATEWRRLGDINDAQEADIIDLLNSREGNLWRPVLFVIPKTPEIDRRLEYVPPALRAGHGPEFRIADLRFEEFDLLDVHDAPRA